ncbi:CRASP family complement regulator-acquiring lipoprotein [Borrelia persica]|uniref:CRASP family complement regulator-acquiring lipoprotein n=1 Tax=Borrelia persica TaxID=44448 RepID=UPI000465072C|nr:CRASP family complement regulator-acquiring lipoprotein [Borrelia persica]
MKKIYNIFCILFFLYLLLTCSLNRQLTNGHNTNLDVRHGRSNKGDDTDTISSESYLDLIKSIKNIKKTLYAKSTGFDATQFDSMFQVCPLSGTQVQYDEKTKMQIYASLDYDIRSLNKLKSIIRNLVNFGDSQSCSLVTTLLRDLNISYEYVGGIIDENGFILNVVNLGILRARNDVMGLRDLKSRLESVLSRHNTLVTRLNTMLESAMALYSMPGRAHVVDMAVVHYITPLIAKKGAIHNIIFNSDDFTAVAHDATGELSLQSLRNLIMEKVNKLVK